MNRLRSYRDDVREADANRGRACRQCGKALTGRRRAYCSDECRVEWLAPRVWSVAVRAVEARDKGVCAVCGRDAVDIMKRFTAIKARAWSRDPEVVRQAETERRALIADLNAAGFHLAAYTSLPLWGDLYQIDHIIPVAEGGGGCPVSNLQTLCTACHKAKTAEQAKRAAARRKPQLRLPIKEV